MEAETDDVTDEQGDARTTAAHRPGSSSVGDTVAVRASLSECDAQKVAEANALHPTDSFAETTRFDGRIARGTLSGLVNPALACLLG